MSEEINQPPTDETTIPGIPPPDFTKIKFEDKIVNFFNKAGKVIGIIIASLLILLLIIKIFVNDPQYYKDNKKEQKQIQANIDSVYQTQDQINQRLKNLEIGQQMFYDVIAQSNQNQQNIERKIDNLKRYFNEKIKSVNRYNAADLDSFFRTRYKEYYE